VFGTFFSGKQTICIIQLLETLFVSFLMVYIKPVANLCKMAPMAKFKCAPFLII